MKFVLKISIILVYCALIVLAKGGDSRGRGSGGGGGSSGGGSSGGSTGGSSGGTISLPLRESGTPGVRGPAGTGNTPSSVSSKGGTGGFGGPPPKYYSINRRHYPPSAPAYSGGYTSATRYGYMGFYNPALIYFAIMPPFMFYGYHSAYHRYNQNNGYYYAPQLTVKGSNSGNVMIDGTVYSGKGDNYRFTFNTSTDNQYAYADHGFFSSSAPEVREAEFVYRLLFSDLVEFDDANQNGKYDANEEIYSVTSLRNLKWSPFQVSNITVPNNATQFYLQTSTFANVTYNNTGYTAFRNPSFGVRITYRTSNVQLNNTAPIVMQPNSLQYDFAIEGFPSNVYNNHPNACLAVAQLLSTMPHVPVNFDVNMTTPVDIANQIKTNQTYGLSIGNYTEGRAEYQNTVNISDVTNGTRTTWGYSIKKSMDNDFDTFPDFIWGSIYSYHRVHKVLFITLPNYNNSTLNGTTINTSYSGFGFLDTDVMNALATGGSSHSFGILSTSSLVNIAVVSSMAVYFIAF